MSEEGCTAENAKHSTVTWLLVGVYLHRLKKKAIIMLRYYMSLIQIIYIDEYFTEIALISQVLYHEKWYQNIKGNSSLIHSFIHLQNCDDLMSFSQRSL